MFQRHARRRVEEALLDTPVVLIHGPRQAGKSTLADVVTSTAKRSAVTLDDPLALALARRDPSAFLRTYAPPVTIDEIQRAPELFLPIKLAVDQKRDPGSYLLTGSANVLSLPKLSDSLAGRMEVVDLLPLSQGEIESKPDGFVEAVFRENFDPSSSPEPDEDLFERIVRGGFPEPVQRRSRRRTEWFENYIRTLLERDVKDIASIEGLPQIPLLLAMIASRTGATLNMSSLAVDTGIAYTSLRRYMGLLETLFLVNSVGTWSQNTANSLTKTPKSFLTDTGLLCHLAQITPKTLGSEALRLRPVLENFVASELSKQCAFASGRPKLKHLRTVRHLEVDFVLEARGLDVVGVQVKAAHTLHQDDADGLRFLKELAGPRFRRGVVLYLGDRLVPLDERIIALPISALWETH